MFDSSHVCRYECSSSIRTLVSLNPVFIIIVPLRRRRRVPPLNSRSSADLWRRAIIPSGRVAYEQLGMK